MDILAEYITLEMHISFLTKFKVRLKQCLETTMMIGHEG